MMLVFIAWGSYPGFQDAVRCAHARSGLFPHVISDQHVHFCHHHDITVYEHIHTRLINQLYSMLPEHRRRYVSLPILRWLVLLEFLGQNQKDLTWPVFCADWDVMIFQDLTRAYLPFRDYDYTVSIDSGVSSAAYCINRLEPLAAYADMIDSMVWRQSRAIVDRGESIHLNDMDLWQRNEKLHDWRVGDLNRIHNGSVFDHNIHCGGHDYQCEPDSSKTIEWVSNQPSFRHRTGGLVKANTVHCWGSYKGRTGELLKLAGVV